MRVLAQYTHHYPSGRLGHIAAFDGGAHLVVVYPLQPPTIGSLPVEASDTLEGAVTAANAIAGEPSATEEWRGHGGHEGA